MRIQKPAPTELSDVEDMRWAFVGVAFMAGLAWVTVPMALSGYASLQAANGDGSPALLVAWLVYWLLAIFPAVFAIGSVRRVEAADHARRRALSIHPRSVGDLCGAPLRGASVGALRGSLSPWDGGRANSF